MIDEAIILAGGFGTRLRSVVSDVPKPMAPIDGKPFLHWLLDGLGRHGIKRIVLATGYMADKITNNLGTNYHGIKLAYSLETKPLGTGGALWQALNFCHSKRVFTLNGDTWLNAPLKKVGESFPEADIVMSVREVSKQERFGGVDLKGDRVIGLTSRAKEQKQVLINAGLYVFKTDLPEHVSMPENFSLENDIFAHPDNIDIRAYICHGSFLDIGTPEDYKKAQTLIPEWVNHA